MSLATLGLAVRYRRGNPLALTPTTLSVDERETLAIVGPSGAGKTTLLRAIAGLVRAEGTVRLGTATFAGDPPQRRGIAVVFQHDALVPTMTLRENLRFTAPRDADIEAAAAHFAIDSLLDRHPHQVSGGERSRAALARAVLSGARALLLDEPFAHLDPPLRLQMLRWLRTLRDRFSGPIVYVTHDHRDAMMAGDRVAVLLAGAIADIGAPRRVYERPATIDVARFFGDRPMNVIDGAAFDATDTLAAFRPEMVRYDADGWSARVLGREFTGSDAFLRVESRYGEIVMRVPVAEDPTGEIRIGIARDAVTFYDRNTGCIRE